MDEVVTEFRMEKLMTMIGDYKVLTKYIKGCWSGDQQQLKQTQRQLSIGFR